MKPFQKLSFTGGVLMCEKTEQCKTKQSAVRGSLLGGAVGDALGYAVEFYDMDKIRRIYGDGGIRAYEYSRRTGKARVSDDTQMTLFTAAGLLNCCAANVAAGGYADPTDCIRQAYRDWYLTQFCRDEPCFAQWQTEGRKPATWLFAIPQMYGRRAPGNTCLSAISLNVHGTVEAPINNSKGCGGVMRVAPVGLLRQDVQSREELIRLGWEAARAAAVTHGHPLGYIPAAGLAMMVNRAAFGGCPYRDGLEGILRECRELLSEMFSGEPELALQLSLLESAEALARNSRPDTENIPLLGEGWVAEETLAIAVYCCLRYRDDFSGAVIAAVNHSGDSDSTGAVAGNLLGAWLGAEAIEPRWLERLELKEIIETVAQDLCMAGSPEAAVECPAWAGRYPGADRA